MPRQYIFAAGGTGGHIMPALAVASALKKQEPAAKILFIGAGTPLEQKLIATQFDLQTISFVPVLGKGIKGLAKMCFRVPFALLEASRLYRKLQPNAIFAFGGYPSVIPTLAGFMHRVPRVLHEQNAKVGLANKLLALFCNQVFAVPGASGFFMRRPTAYIPNPVRPEFAALPDWQYPTANQRFVLLVLGGSQGAKRINEAILTNANILEENGIDICHVAGEAHREEVEQDYKKRGLHRVKVFGFVAEPWKLLEDAHLVISRAGAMAAAELCSAARPVLYIPLTIASAHQSENIAKQLESGAAMQLAQDESLDNNLLERLLTLKNQTKQLERLAHAMKSLRAEAGRNSAEILAEAISDLARTPNAKFRPKE